MPEQFVEQANQRRVVRTEIGFRPSPVKMPVGNARAAVRSDARVCEVWRTERQGYREVWALQQKWVEQRKHGEIPDRLFFVEHSPVITLGRNARHEHVLTPLAELQRKGIELVECDRGGDVTFHGPGQLVCYPILDLALIRKDVGWYLRTLEEALIDTLAELGLDAGRRAGMTGVWVNDAKVAAIGVHISRWVTSHGFALNVDTDLSYFRNIVPCGIAAHPVTSLQQLTGRHISRSWLESRLAAHLGDLLGRSIAWTPPDRGEGIKLCQPPTC
jgi:lipoyl(octanoyl) transferase